MIKRERKKIGDERENERMREKECVSERMGRSRNRERERERERERKREREVPSLLSEMGELGEEVSFLCFRSSNMSAFLLLSASLFFNVCKFQGNLLDIILLFIYEKVHISVTFLFYFSLLLL